MPPEVPPLVTNTLRFVRHVSWELYIHDLRGDLRGDLQAHLMGDLEEPPPAAPQSEATAGRQRRSVVINVIRTLILVVLLPSIISFITHTMATSFTARIGMLVLEY